MQFIVCFFLFSCISIGMWCLGDNGYGVTSNMKVWSDLKNNTKRKAARIHKAATGTGGGPANILKLSDLEERVLNILGSQAATGIVQIEEIGLIQVIFFYFRSFFNLFG